MYRLTSKLKLVLDIQSRCRHLLVLLGFTIHISVLNIYPDKTTNVFFGTFNDSTEIHQVNNLYHWLSFEKDSLFERLKSSSPLLREHLFCHAEFHLG